MDAKFFTPQELTQMEFEDSLCLREAAILQATQLHQRSQQLKDARAELKVEQQRVVQLEELLAAAQRAAKRQAAPFRVPEAKRSQAPKRPGRLAGHPGAFRPRPAQIDQDFSVPLELKPCPQCGALHWSEPRLLEQYIEELPAVRPQVTRLRTYEATCVGCGHTMASRHPLQVSQATGAAGVQLGPRALALAADLNKAKHLTTRKTCAVLHDHFGLKLTPGGLCQALARVARRMETQYSQIQQELCDAPVAYVDETSWWVAGAIAWLWVFTHPLGAFYFIAKSRGREVLEAVLGFAPKCLLVSDCLSVYDLESGLQHKCYSHHLEAIRKALEAAPAQAQAPEAFLPQAKALLQSALALGKTRRLDSFSPAAFAQERHRLDATADALFALPHAHRQEEIIHHRLIQQRDHLFTFLDHPGVDATNPAPAGPTAARRHRP
jgi:transposase